VVFFFPNNVLVSFNSRQVGHAYDDILCRVFAMNGTVDTHYSGKVWLRSRDDAFEGDTKNLYAEGTKINIGAFHDAIAQGAPANLTVAPSVRSNLTTILGRMAAYNQGEVTWKDMIAKNEKWEFDTKGLKA
jgi:hypothetical protein